MRPSMLKPPSRPSQTGGITIMVALMLLVFLTLAALGMTRNSFREILTSGTVRQAAMAENAADSGIEWATYWLYSGNVPPSTAVTPTEVAGANGLIQLLLQNQGFWGQYMPVSNFGTASSPNFYTGPSSQSLASDTTLPNSPTGVTQGFTASLMLMGKFHPTVTSQTVGGSSTVHIAAGGFDPTAPDFWAVRSDGQVTINNVTFRQSREAWISTPARIAQ